MSKIIKLCGILFMVLLAEVISNVVLRFLTQDEYKIGHASGFIAATVLCLLIFSYGD